MNEDEDYLKVDDLVKEHLDKFIPDVKDQAMTDRDVQFRRDQALKYALELSHGATVEDVLNNAKKIDAFLEYGDWSPEQKSSP